MKTNNKIAHILIIGGIVVQTFTACGNHNWDDLEDIIFGESSSSELEISSSSRISSSSLKPSSSSSTKQSSSSSSSSSSRNHIAPCPNAATTPVDAKGIGSLDCGGQTYKTIKIGGQVWMAENLNYNAEGSKCGETDGNLKDEDTENCDKYGRLYNWYAATDVCPSGWHLPHDADWNVLMKFVNPSCSDNSDCADAGTKLKARSGWNEGGNGTDNYGFSALPGGVGNSDGGFYNFGFFGDWWSSSEESTNIAYGRGVYLNVNDVRRLSIDKNYYLFSVRCVEN